MFAPVSLIAVVASFSGFLQPEVMCNESTKEQQLSVFSLIIPFITSAGSPRQACGFQYMLSVLPPIVFALVAPSLCPSFRDLQVLLVWVFVTL